VCNDKVLVVGTGCSWSRTVYVYLGAGDIEK